MTTHDDPRLDDFERRLHELESELAELRLEQAALGAEPADGAEPAVEPSEESETPAWAQEWIDGGDVRGLLNELERMRRQALEDDDVAALQEVLVAIRAIYAHADRKHRNRAGQIANAAQQNIRFLERKLGVQVDITPALPPRPEAPVEAPAEVTAESEMPPWAQQWIDRGDFGGLLDGLEFTRRQALKDDDLAALPDLLQVTELVDWESVGLGARAATLAEVLRQNIRFLESKLGVRVDLAAALPSPVEAPVDVQPPGPEVEQPEASAEPAWRSPSFSLPELSAADLFGAKGLAIAGGIVTLLGIVFFFVLAVNRGWIGPGGRVALGAIASALVFSAGLELRRRYGETYSSFAAVGAGIAGGYAVLLAAAALYDYLGDAAALVIAAAIAATGLVTALRWRSQLVAGIGLLGAMLVPLAVVAQGGLSVLGTAFVAVMYAATAVVAIRYRWNVLLVAGAGVGLAQALALVFQSEYHGASPPKIVVLAAVFSAITVGSGLTLQLRERTPDLDDLATSFLFTGTAFAVGCALRLYGSPESKGFALLAVAVVFGLIAAALFPRRRDRDLSALVGALGLIVGGVAFGELMSGSPLAFAWAGEAAVLAWLAARVREIRYQLFAIAYLLAALVEVLAVDAPPSHLFRALDTSAGGAFAVVAVGAAAAVVAFYAESQWDEDRARSGLFAALAPLYRELAAGQRFVRLGGYLLASLAAVYALSLGVLAAIPSFGWGHVAMYALWSAIGLGMYTVGLQRQDGRLRAAGLGWLTFTVVATIVDGEKLMAADPRAVALLVVGTALLAAMLTELFVTLAPIYEELTQNERILRLGGCWAAALTAIVALSLGVLAAVPSYDWGHVVMYTLWSVIGLGVYALALRRRAGQIRAGSLVWLTFTAVAAIAHGEKSLATDPRAVALLFVGTVLFAVVLTELFVVLAPIYDELAARQSFLRLAGCWLAALAAIGALSLGVLAAVPSYDWGHVAMYTLWSAIGLGVFTFALRRQAGEICTGSLFWLAVTVVTVFANGESSLAANPRGVAFLVVGGTVLAAAFIEQLLGRRRGLTPVALALALASVSLGLGAITALLGGPLGSADEIGLGLLGLALLYAVLSASVFRLEGQRDFATLLWGTALVLGYGSSVRLLPGTYYVLVLSLAAVLLAVLAPRVREPRLMVAAVVCVLVGVATVILGLTPPSHLFRAQASPGHGALGALFVAIAAAVVAHLARESELGRRAATVGWWTAGVLVVYGLSLFILELFQVSFAGSVDSNFHRGHTAVSAFWGLIGLALLYVGLTRLRALRVAGFVMFTVALAKIFLFDLPSLSSITRALSFLAVGAVLMLGGFFYQRLATAQPAPPAKRRRERLEWPPGLGRPELVVAIMAAVVLIVWFGSGSFPLGKSSEDVSAAVPGQAVAAAPSPRAPSPPAPTRRGARVPVRCELYASVTGGTVGLLVNQCASAVNRIVVSYPLKPGAAKPYEDPAKGGPFDCPVRLGRVVCKVDPPFTGSDNSTIMVDTSSPKTAPATTVTLSYIDGRRSITRVPIE